MRDGVCLSTDIRFPETPDPCPVILIRTPYNNAAFSGEEAAYVAAGYVVAKQDCRGRFDSDGSFNPLVEPEDGHDTIAWIHAQPWCNGRIGMTGNSYCAITQLSAAWTRPPGLDAISPGVMGNDFFKGLVYHNGVFNLSLAIGWGTGVAGRTGQGNETTDWERVFNHLPLITMDEAAGYRLDYFREWLEHPTYDEYWAASSVERHFSDMDVPAFHIGGWYDMYAAGTLRNFCGLRSSGGGRARGNQKVMIGPWVHGINTRVAGQIDFGEEATVPLEMLRWRWLDRWLKDDANGIDDEAPVRLFVMGVNRWQNEQTWPLERGRERAWHLASRGAANSLHGDGLLTTESVQHTDTDTYLYNPAEPVPTLGGGCLRAPAGPTDHQPIERRDDVLVFTSDWLQEPLEVIGNVRSVLYVASDAVDTDVVARLCDVFPDGRSIILCDGIVRARFREGLDREVMMAPGKVYELTVDMGVTANVFLPGHRLRLEVTSSCFPRFARNLNTGEPAATGTRMQTARQTIHHSAAHPSRLILPVVPAAPSGR